MKMVVSENVRLRKRLDFFERNSETQDEHDEENGGEEDQADGASAAAWDAALSATRHSLKYHDDGYAY